MAARKFGMFVIESSYGTPKSAPVKGTDLFYLHYDKPTSFKAKTTPQVIKLPRGGGDGTPFGRVSDVKAFTFDFDFPLYPTIAPTLLQWALQPIVTGRAIPWTTTDADGVMPIGDLASLAFYDATLKEDGTTYDRKVYLGCKCLRGTIAASEDANGRIFRFSGSAVAQKRQGNPWDSSTDPTALVFAPPDDTDIPTGAYLFSHLGSGTSTVLVGASPGTNRKTFLQSLSISWDNTIQQGYYTSQFLTWCRFFRRDMKVALKMRRKFTPDDRNQYETLAAQTCKVLLDNGTNTITFDLQNNAIIDPWDETSEFDREWEQTLTFNNQWDTTAEKDFALTLT